MCILDISSVQAAPYRFVPRSFRPIHFVPFISSPFTSSHPHPHSRPHPHPLPARDEVKGDEMNGTKWMGRNERGTKWMVTDFSTLESIRMTIRFQKVSFGKKTEDYIVICTDIFYGHLAHHSFESDLTNKNLVRTNYDYDHEHLSCKERKFLFVIW